MTSTPQVCCGNNLVVHQLYAEFSGGTDTVLNCVNLASVGGAPLTGFWHKDGAAYPLPCSTEFGTWNPAVTGSTNRPCDSFFTIGCCYTSSALSCPPDQAALPVSCGWFNSNPPALCGRVAVGCNPPTRVLLGQFALLQGEPPRTYSLTVGYNDGLPGSSVQFGTGTFTLCGGATNWYRDLDGDGFGAAIHGTMSVCEQPQGYVANNLDNCPCNPNPTQADSDGDGIGDACDGAGVVDCNGNGNSDSCDIASGISTDLNANQVPDECELVVGGSGYSTVQAAIDAAPAGSTIFIASGTYFGGILIDGRTNLTLRAIGGAASATIDGTGRSESVMRIRQSQGITVEGLRLRNGVTGSICFGQYLCGGGALIEESSGVSIRECWFESNRSGSGGGLAVYNSIGTAENCKFFGNEATMDGGGVEVGFFSDFVMTGCLLSGNSAPRGGGANAWDTTLRLEGCTFDFNFAVAVGGGLSWYSRFGTPVEVQGCEFTRNSAIAGGAVTRIEGTQLFRIGGTRMCLNLPDAIDAPYLDLGGNTFDVDCNGNGICDLDDIASGARDCDGNGALDSCDIAAGAVDTDADGRIDACEYAQGDLNLDGLVGPADLAILLARWGTVAPPAGDLNGDGFIAGADLAILLTRWGPVSF